MDNRSTIDRPVESALTELEYEFENEMGAEFEDLHLPNYKWIVYTPVKGVWKQERWVQSKAGWTLRKLISPCGKSRPALDCRFRAFFDVSPLVHCCFALGGRSAWGLRVAESFPGC
jgi:hypothetical protein